MALPDLEMFEKSLLQGVQVGDTAMTEPDLEAVNILRDLGKIDQDQRRRSFDVAPRGSYRDRFSSFGSLDTLSEVALASANLDGDISGSNTSPSGETLAPHSPFSRRKVRSASISAILSKEHVRVYNAGGRIGIYTPEERAKKLEIFHQKRRRRSFAKKIRYNCRKSLADKRIRIKGRFVKSTEAVNFEKEQRDKSSSETSSRSSTPPRRSPLSAAASPMTSPPPASAFKSPSPALRGGVQTRARSQVERAVTDLVMKAAAETGKFGDGAGGGKKEGEFSAGGEVTMGRRRRVGSASEAVTSSKLEFGEGREDTDTPMNTPPPSVDHK